LEKKFLKTQAPRAKILPDTHTLPEHTDEKKTNILLKLEDEAKRKKMNLFFFLNADNIND